MKKALGYALLTCTIAYFLAAVILFVLGLSQTNWSRIDHNTGRFIASTLTLVLSEFQGWGSLWYLAVLVPWLGSTLLLALLVKRFGAEARRRYLFGGASVGIYYVIMLLVFVFGKLITSWYQIDINPGDIIYVLLLIWPLGGFGLGYLAAMITDRIIRLPAAN
jgi:hypothetical protein